MFTFQDIEKMAESAIKTGFFPGVKTKDEAVTLMTMAQAEGLHPIVGLRMFHIMAGRPVMRAEAMLARFQQAGGKVQWVSVTADECKAKFMAPGVDGAYEAKWTLKMGQEAGLAGNAQWKKFPQAMLKARAISDGVRSAMPAVVVGVYTPEEVADFDTGKGDAAPVVNSPVPVVTAADAPAAPASAAAVEELPKEAQAMLKAAMEKAFPLLSDAKESKKVAAELRGDFIAKVLGRKVKGYGDMTPDEAKAVIEATEYGDRDA